VTPERIEACFTRESGDYAFARWGRPIVPVVFGVDDATLAIVKGAIEAVVALAGHNMAETDPELGANLMLFFFREWDELKALPDLERMIPGLGPLVGRLKAQGAGQYRTFRFDEAGAIRACFAFVRMGREMSRLPAETIALVQAVEAVLAWSDAAFRARSPLAVLPGSETAVIAPDIAGLVRAAYDPVMPVAAGDAAHALRLFARMQAR
jgi:hypothetical protein